MKFIEKYIDKPWNNKFISQNYNIIPHELKKRCPGRFRWDGISQNPNITIDFIEKYIDKLDFGSLSINTFTYQNKLDRQKGAYMLLEKDQSFHKLQNLYVVKQYM